MKNIQNLLSFIFILTVSSVAQATELETIYDVIGLHQKDMLKRRGKEVSLMIVNTPETNATSSYQAPGNAPLIKVNTGYLDLFIDDEIITPVCHELGHFLGETSFASYYSGSFAIESEADYYGGKCAVRYYQSKGMRLDKAQELTIYLARNARSKNRRMRFDPDRARLDHVVVIDTDYAHGDCRVLSVVHGAMGWARPSCWYSKPVKLK